MTEQGVSAAPPATLSRGATELIRLLATGPSRSRAEVGELTGWARVTVNARIDELLAAGLLRVDGAVEGARGRPAARFGFDGNAGTLLIADIGASAARLARCDLSGTIVDQITTPLAISDGPDPILELVTAKLTRLLVAEAPPLWGVGISLPGPIEHRTGRVAQPPIMTGWDGVVVPERLHPSFGVPILVENDANAMAWGEHIRTENRGDLLLVKVGTGVGAGIVANGRILRGAQGSAGDLAHTYAEADADGDTPLCRCGKLGCVEAYAGGWAIIRDLKADGEPAESVADVVALVAAGNPHAISRVRQAGRVLGASLAGAVSLLNPAEIIIAGQLAGAGEHLLAGVREHVAARALPLATENLRIRTSAMPLEIGVIGMADALASWVLELRAA